jgi:hypothetical protein
MSTSPNLPGPRLVASALADAAALGPMPARPMTPDERRGFNWALGCLMLWGAQLERSGRMTGGAAEATIPLTEAMSHGGRMVRGCAEALHLTMGRPA